MSRRLVALFGAFVLAGALGACGDDDESERAATTGTGTATAEEPPQEPSGEAVATVDVTETEFKLDPENPRVDKAGVVEFRVSNDGGTVHALEVETPEGEFETEEIQPGDKATLKADLPEGELVWYCPVDNHRELGMEGKITVAGGGGGAAGDDDSGSAGGDGGY